MEDNPNPNQANLHPILNPIVDRYEQRTPDDKAEVRLRLGEYIRIYAFLVQIITFTDAELEKFYQFGRLLWKKLPFAGDRYPTNLTNYISIDTNFDIYQKLTDDTKLRELFRQVMFNNFQQYLAKRNSQASGE